MMRAKKTEDMTPSAHGDMLDDIRRRSTLTRIDVQQDEKTLGSSKSAGTGIWECLRAFPSSFMPLTTHYFRVPIDLELGL